MFRWFFVMAVLVASLSFVSVAEANGGRYRGFFRGNNQHHGHHNANAFFFVAPPVTYYQPAPFYSPAPFYGQPAPFSGGCGHGGAAFYGQPQSFFFFRRGH